MKKTICMIAVATIVLAMGCTKTETVNPSLEQSPSPGHLKAMTGVPFYILQNVQVGNVDVYSNNGNLFIYANLTEPDWEFKENHIYAGVVAPASHNPMQFPYVGTTSADAKSIFFSIPFGQLGAECGIFYIAFHAKVKQPNSGAELGWAIPGEGLAIYWYAAGGNQIGWGAYFQYDEQCGSNISIDQAVQPIPTVNAQVRYRNFVQGGPQGEPEIQLWPNGGVSGMETVDFGAGSYLTDPLSNHIRLVFTPYVIDQNGDPNALLTCQTIASQTFNYGINPTPTQYFNVIQFELYKKGGKGEKFVLENIAINGVLIEVGPYLPLDPEEIWNITGNLLAYPGICNFEADLRIINYATSADDCYLEIRFGTL